MLLQCALNRVIRMRNRQQDEDSVECSTYPPIVSFYGTPGQGTMCVLRIYSNKLGLQLLRVWAN